MLVGDAVYLVSVGQSTYSEAASLHDTYSATDDQIGEENTKV